MWVELLNACVSEHVGRSLRYFQIYSRDALNRLGYQRSERNHFCGFWYHAPMHTCTHTTTNHKPTNQYHTHMLTKANTIKIDKSQSEIGRLLRLYYAKDNIDDELEFSKQRIETLRRRGRLDTPEGSYLQQKITGLEPSVELRKVVVGRPRPPSRLTHLPRALPSHSPDIYIYMLSSCVIHSPHLYLHTASPLTQQP